MEILTVESRQISVWVPVCVETRKTNLYSPNVSSFIGRASESTSLSSLSLTAGRKLNLKLWTKSVTLGVCLPAFMLSCVFYLRICRLYGVWWSRGWAGSVSAARWRWWVQWTNPVWQIHQPPLTTLRDGEGSIPVSLIDKFDLTLNRLNMETIIQNYRLTLMPSFGILDQFQLFWPLDNFGCIERFGLKLCQNSYI